MEDNMFLGNRDRRRGGRGRGRGRGGRGRGRGGQKRSRGEDWGYNPTQQQMRVIEDTSNGPNFTMDIMEEGDPMAKLEHRRLGTFVVGTPGGEYTVRVIIHPGAWNMHQFDFYKAVLKIDDNVIGSRFMGNPAIHGRGQGGNVVWEWKFLPSGHAMCFGDRRGGDGDSAMSAKEKNSVGRIVVEFQAAQGRSDEEMFYDQMERQERNAAYGNKPRRNREYDGAEKVKFDAHSKDTFSTLRTVKGRMIKKSRGGGPRGSVPARLVGDYVYKQLVVQYDSAKHLMFRGILRPQHEPAHRYFFPGMDFSEKKKEPQGPAETIDLLSDDDDAPAPAAATGGVDEWEQVYEA